MCVHYKYFGVHYNESMELMCVFLNNHYVSTFGFEISAALVTVQMETPVHSALVVRHEAALGQSSVGSLQSSDGICVLVGKERTAYSPHLILYGDTRGGVGVVRTATMQAVRAQVSERAAVLVTTAAGSWHLISLAEFPGTGEEKKGRLHAHTGAINDSDRLLITVGRDGLI
jgi:hypothetical protein